MFAILREPAFWAALAAIGSATAAWLSWRVQRRNYLDSIRPEIHLDGWKFNPDVENGNRGRIGLENIENFGRGPASPILMNVVQPGLGRRFSASMSTNAIHLLRPNEKKEIKSQVRIFWDKTMNTPRIMFIRLQVITWDRDRNRHTTTYDLTAFEDVGTVMAGAEELAPGLYTLPRGYKFQSATALRWEKRLRKAKGTILTPPKRAWDGVKGLFKAKSA